MWCFFPLSSVTYSWVVKSSLSVLSWVLVLIYNIPSTLKDGMLHTQSFLSHSHSSPDLLSSNSSAWVPLQASAHWLCFVCLRLTFLALSSIHSDQEYNPQGFQDLFTIAAFPVSDCGRNIDVSSLKPFPYEVSIITVLAYKKETLAGCPVTSNRSGTVTRAQLSVTVPDMIVRNHIIDF